MNEQSLLNLINQVFDLEKKIKQKNENSLLRNINRIRDIISESGYVITDPLGQEYNETRTDCEASIAGEGKGRPVITEVLKPAVYKKDTEVTKLIQQAVVIVEGK